MTKVNLNKSITDLDGNAIEGSNLGKLVAQMLVTSNKGDALKYMAWALKLHNGETLELDPSDLQNLKTFVESHEQLTILSKAQILDALK